MVGNEWAVEWIKMQASPAQYTLVSRPGPVTSALRIWPRLAGHCGEASVRFWKLSGLQQKITYTLLWFSYKCTTLLNTAVHKYIVKTQNSVKWKSVENCNCQILIKIASIRKQYKVNNNNLCLQRQSTSLFKRLNGTRSKCVLLQELLKLIPKKQFSWLISNTWFSIEITDW